MRRIEPKSGWATSSLLIGGLFGVFLVGLRNLAPWNYSWLYSKGDGALTQLGFEFFRKAPLFQWPLAAVPKYVVGSNMILPTENAVTNIFGKLVGEFIPGNFQFVGLWIVFCFALQGYFGAKLLSRFIDSGITQLFGSLFFVLSPALIYRVGVMNHYSLGSHWMILVALFLYFGTEFRTRAWGTLLFFAMLTSIYISAMLVVVFVAHQLKIYLQAKKVRITTFVLPLVASACGFWVMGYLSMSSSITGSNFFRLNALAWFNPGYSDRGSFSMVLNTVGNSRLRQLFSEEWEGFQYLGTVVAAGALLGLVNLRNTRILRNWREYAPIAIAACALFTFALSNHIVILHQEFNYWWPSSLFNLRQVFRGATRFGWPAYYLVTLFAVVQISRFVSVRKLKFGVTIAMVVMVAESSSGIAYVHREFSTSKPYVSSISDLKWNEISANHSKLVIYPNFDLQVGEVTGDAKVWVSRWFDLAKFAVDHDLSTNFGYVPRPLTDYIAAQNSQILNEMGNGKLQPKTIYVLANETIWERVSRANAANADAYKIDGLFVISTKG
ncbi:MAG: DUF6311 domain-containing protein [Actinomycetota bacterium]